MFFSCKSPTLGSFPPAAVDTKLHSATRRVHSNASSKYRTQLQRAEKQRRHTSVSPVKSSLQDKAACHKIVKAGGGVRRVENDCRTWRRSPNKSANVFFGILINPSTSGDLATSKRHDAVDSLQIQFPLCSNLSEALTDVPYASAQAKSPQVPTRGETDGIESSYRNNQCRSIT